MTAGDGGAQGFETGKPFPGPLAQEGQGQVQALRPGPPFDLRVGALPGGQGCPQRRREGQCEEESQRWFRHLMLHPMLGCWTSRGS